MPHPATCIAALGPQLTSAVITHRFGMLGGTTDYARGSTCLPWACARLRIRFYGYITRWVSPSNLPCAGLFRVIAWVLNGLELDVHNATLETDESGTVHARSLASSLNSGCWCHSHAV